MLFNGMDRDSIFCYLSQSRDSALGKHSRAGESKTSVISPKAQSFHLIQCIHSHVLCGFATDGYINFHLVFCKYCYTVCTNVLQMYFRHWLSFFRFVHGVCCAGLLLSKLCDAVCPAALTREQNMMCSSPDPQDFQLFLRAVCETFISVKKGSIPGV